MYDVLRMLRLSVHIPDETRRRISLAAKARNTARAEVIREALKEGLEVIHPKSASAQSLLDFAREMAKIPTKGKLPKDLIENLDYYTWGGTKHK